MERLHKVMARAGIASRRKCEELILDGRVRVSGSIVDCLGAKIDPTKDKVVVDGKILTLPSKRYYVLLNKPRGYLTTSSDRFGRPTVMDLVRKIGARLYPVGRLDKNSEGLLLLTNDGDLAFRLTHPRFKVPKVYLVKVEGFPQEQELNRLRAGIVLEDGPTLPARVDVFKKKEKTTWLKITILEGRKRQVRRMCGRVGHPVRRLVRIALGPISLGELPVGQHRLLTQEEVNGFYRAVRLDVEGERREEKLAR